MRVQIDRFEDGGWAVLMPFEDNARGFDVPRELLPEGSVPGDVFEFALLLDREASRRLAEENRRLTEELLRDGEA